MRRRRGKIGGIGILAVLGCLGYAASLFAPPYWDFRMVKKICKDAALTYRTTGSLLSAQQKYKSGLKKENIPYYIKDRDCHFRETKSFLTIQCDWVAPIEVPILDIDLSKNYSFRMSIDRDGVIDEF
jgi:hypothetical protein